MAWRSPAQIQAKSPAELIMLAKSQLASSRVFVYLHDRSTVLNLRADSTALDAAFSIHTDVGLSASAVRINGRRVAMNRQLRNGDVIDVERSKDGSVTALPSWQYLAKTPHAISVMRKYFRDNHRDQLVCEGCVLLAATLDMSASLKPDVFRRKIPKAAKLVSIIRGRSGHKDVTSFLQTLAAASKTDRRECLSKLFGVSPDDLCIPSVPTAVVWARTEAKQRWSDTRDVLDLQLDLLTDVLPGLGLPLVERHWCKLVGDTLPHSVNRLSGVSSASGSGNRSNSNLSSRPQSAFLVPPIHYKSHIAKARQPFSLEAASLPLPLLKLARRNYADKATLKERQLEQREDMTRTVVSLLRMRGPQLRFTASDDVLAMGPAAILTSIL